MSQCVVAEGEEIFAAQKAYRKQVKFGNPPRSALVAATIVYLQRNPSVPVIEARNRVARAVGIRSG